jgi:hypothetical protein
MKNIIVKSISADEMEEKTGETLDCLFPITQISTGRKFPCEITLSLAQCDAMGVTPDEVVMAVAKFLSNYDGKVENVEAVDFTVEDTAG